MIIKDYDTANESFEHIELAFVVFFYFLANCQAKCNFLE